MPWWICAGHGSLEDDASSEFEVFDNVTVVIYAPPGAAIADDLAELIHGRIEKGHAKDLPTFFEELRFKVAMKGRVSKGLSADAKPLTGWDQYPIAYETGTVCPNLTLTGSGSLSHSGIYKEPPRLTVAMSGADTKRLKQVANQASLSHDGHVVIHWLACCSDHTAEKTSSTFSGFKVGLG